MDVKVHHQWFNYNNGDCDDHLNKRLSEIYVECDDNLLNWNISSCTNRDGTIFLRLTWVTREKTTNVD